MHAIVTTVQNENQTWSLIGWIGMGFTQDKKEYKDEKTAAVAAAHLAQLRKWVFLPNRKFVTLLHEPRPTYSAVIVTLPEKAPANPSHLTIDMRGIQTFCFQGALVPMNHMEAAALAKPLANERKLHFEPKFFPPKAL